MDTQIENNVSLIYDSRNSRNNNNYVFFQLMVEQVHHIFREKLYHDV